MSVDRVDHSPAIKKNLGGLDRPLLGCKVERSKSLTIRSIRVGPTIQQGPNSSEVVFQGGVMQRSSPVTISFQHSTILFASGIRACATS